MGNSDSWKLDTPPGGNPPPASPAVAAAKPTPSASDSSAGNSAGRVIHDERGNAVWDWLKDTARIAVDSTSRLLQRLDVPELKVDDTREQEFRKESDRDPGGGYDPYGASVATPDLTSSPRKSGSNSDRGGMSGASKSRSGPLKNASTASGGPSNSTGGGYDPYGKGVTSKPRPKGKP
jgi:hypothetical protein